jgi:hypothetical protein
VFERAHEQAVLCIFIKLVDDQSNERGIITVH